MEKQLLDPLPEMEEQETEILQWNPDEEADTINILNSIGKNEFKETYMLNKNYVRDMNVQKQLIFCSEIFKRLEEVYNYIPPITPHINTLEDIEKVYEFIEFIEFKNVNFLASLFHKILPLDVRINIKDLIESNWDVIVSRINKIPKKTNYLITDFLKLNSKINLLNFLSRAFNINKFEILVTMNLKS